MPNLRPPSICSPQASATARTPLSRGVKLTWNLGVDGLFSDFADDAVTSRSMFAADQFDVVDYAEAAVTNAATRFFRTTAEAGIRKLAAAKGLARTADSFEAWTTVQSDAVLSTAVYRYFDSKNSRHFFSIDITQGAGYAAAGNSNEGVAFCSPQ